MLQVSNESIRTLGFRDCTSSNTEDMVVVYAAMSIEKHMDHLWLIYGMYLYIIYK